MKRKDEEFTLAVYFLKGCCVSFDRGGSDFKVCQTVFSDDGDALSVEHVG